MMSLLAWHSSAFPYSVSLRTGDSLAPGTRMCPLSLHLNSSCCTQDPWWPGHATLFLRPFPRLKDELLCWSYFQLKSLMCQTVKPALSLYKWNTSGNTFKPLKTSLSPSTGSHLISSQANYVNPYSTSRAWPFYIADEAAGQFIVLLLQGRNCEPYSWLWKHGSRLYDHAFPFFFPFNLGYLISMIRDYSFSL